MYSIPRSEDSNFIAVFDPYTHTKKMHYSKLDNRVSVILPVAVNNAVSLTSPSSQGIVVVRSFCLIMIVNNAS